MSLRKWMTGRVEMRDSSSDKEIVRRKKGRSNNFVEKKRKKKNLSLVKFSALPDYLKDNEYILDYYRCEWPLKYIFLSFFSLHNESLNIWTHFVGFLIFVTITMASLMESAMFHNILLYFFRPSFASPLTTLLLKKPNDSYAFSVAGAQSVDESSTLWLQQVSQRGSSGTNTAILIPKWPWFVFLAGAMGCMTASSLSHLLACHSRSFNLFFWRLDYAGISLMIVCSFFAPIYYAFDCKTEWRLLYLTSISMFGILAIITLLSPALSSPRFRSFRGSLFLVMGFSGAIPATHAVFLHWDHPQILLALGYEILMGVLYALGAVFYLTRIPERWKPGAFDIAGASHQIFHCFVVAGALVHTAATLIIMNWRQGLPLNCASPPVAFPT